MSPPLPADLGDFYRRALLDDCVPFWFPRSVDREFGGFLHCLDRDGSVVDTDTSSWAQGRMTWMLLTLYNTVERRPEWLAWAEGGLRFLEEHCFDADGRMFFHVTPDGDVVDHFDGRTLNPGHAIEGAWFILHEGRHRRDDALIKLGCQMLDWMWRRGWDEECGGLFYFRDVSGKPVREYWHDMKFWWTHDEALIATLLAGKLTGEPRYAVWHEQVRAWSFKHFADPQHGEWFGYLHRDGRISNSLKGGLWKSFFHHPRAPWYCGRLLES